MRLICMILSLSVTATKRLGVAIHWGKHTESREFFNTEPMQISCVIGMQILCVIGNVEITQLFIWNTWVYHYLISMKLSCCWSPHWKHVDSMQILDKKSNWCEVCLLFGYNTSLKTEPALYDLPGLLFKNKSMNLTPIRPFKFDKSPNLNS